MKAKKIWFDDYVNLEMEDGRIGRLPLTDFPRLRYATEEQRANYMLSPYGIHWEAIDEDLSYDGFFTQSAVPLNSVARVLKSFPEINVNQLALRMGVNQSLLAKYICGAKKPSPARLREIEQTLHKLGQELSAISL
jgi:hypothetical protein